MNNVDSEHIGRLVRNIYHAVLDESDKQLKAKGYPELDSSYSVVFQYIGEGARATEIASKGRTSKQNIKYLLDMMEKKGYVKRKQDLTDGRAWIFELTQLGKEYRNEGLKIIAEIEKQWAKALGKNEYIQLKKYLTVLNQIIEQKSPTY
ncbi:MarR family winged helix-turn-helix transcriptional regulator [Thermoflexibacter ruber]|uniref:MarR family protein n=1 Tax=Thermoflexibacter ruber TaxID=1003 RepID=A0A1I2II73_9BACT|nr:MarR family transcriptional regulator [Thermoflexibacter ruber]SFF40546.1 MarR family protein [Thermoflexibacter ruber]